MVMIKTKKLRTFGEFCFRAIEDVEDEDKDKLQQAFEDLYKDLFMLAKKSKELKDIIEAMTKENK